MRRTVLIATPDFFARSVCSHPTNARAAFNWRPVIKGKAYHDNDF